LDFCVFQKKKLVFQLSAVSIKSSSFYREKETQPNVVFVSRQRNASFYCARVKHEKAVKATKMLKAKTSIASKLSSQFRED